MAQEIVSIRESIEELGALEDRLGEALAAYGQAFEDVDEQLMRLYPAKLGLPRPDFRAAAAELRVKAGVGAIRRARAGFRAGITAAGRDFENRMAGLVDMSEVMAKIGELNEKLRGSSHRQDERLNGVKNGLESAVATQDLEQMRASLGRQIESLEVAIEAMKQENNSLMEEMEGEMARYRRQLDEAKAMAGEDPVTGLPNFRRLETEVQAHLDSGVRFSMILLGMSQLAFINRHYGSQTGDELLRAFGQRLLRECQEEEKAARWRGSEFAFLIPGGLREAIARSRPIERALSGDYEIMAGARGKIKVHVTARLGIAESRPGDSLDALFTRAESLLLGPG